MGLFFVPHKTKAFLNSHILRLQTTVSEFMSSSFIITTKSSTRLALLQLKKHRSDCLLSLLKAWCLDNNLFLQI